MIFNGNGPVYKQTTKKAPVAKKKDKVKNESPEPIKASEPVEDAPKKSTSKKDKLPAA